MKKRIEITCESSGLAPISEIEKLQGDLKTISPESLDKLKESIKKYGFSFPIFLWNSHILDGHQRFEAVKSLISDGWILDGDLIPVDFIKAKDRKEAGEKLLLINSRYARIDQSGFDVFIDDFDIDLESVATLIDIPDVSLDLDDIYPESISQDDNDQSEVIIRLSIPTKVWAEKADQIKSTLENLDGKIVIRIDE